MNDRTRPTPHPIDAAPLVEELRALAKKVGWSPFAIDSAFCQGVSRGLADALALVERAPTLPAPVAADADLATVRAFIADRLAHAGLDSSSSTEAAAAALAALDRYLAANPAPGTPAPAPPAPMTETKETP